MKKLLLMLCLLATPAFAEDRYSLNVQLPPERLLEVALEEYEVNPNFAGSWGPGVGASRGQILEAALHYAPAGWLDEVLFLDCDNIDDLRSDMKLFLRLGGDWSEFTEGKVLSRLGDFTGYQLQEGDSIITYFMDLSYKPVQWWIDNLETIADTMTRYKKGKE